VSSPKHLPTGCPNSIPDPAKRKASLERVRLDLWDRILQAEDEIGTITHEIDLCDQALNEARECAAMGIPAPDPNPCAENGCTDRENCDEICEHMRIYTPAYVRASRQMARMDLLDAFAGFIDAYSRCDEDGQDYVSVIALQNHIESLRQQEGKP
jgi:hypothetical protein